jgi:hypothetical protein
MYACRWSEAWIWHFKNPSSVNMRSMNLHKKHKAEKHWHFVWFFSDMMSIYNEQKIARNKRLCMQIKWGGRLFSSLVCMTKKNLLKTINFPFWWKFQVHKKIKSEKLTKANSRCAFLNISSKSDIKKFINF